MKTIFKFLFILFVSGWTSALAQDLVVDQLIDPVSLSSDGTTLTIVFDDLKANTAVHFEAQHSDNITRWFPISGSSVADDPGMAHRHILTAPEPSEMRKFYRVVRYTTTLDDLDGDGLSNSFEATLGTLNMDVDSDDDGFNDGIEWANGTDPDDADSILDLADLPAVEFVLANSHFVEGDALTHDVLLQVSGFFSGTVSYSIDAQSTIPGTDISPALSGSVSVNSSGGTINIPFIDDYEIKPSRFLVITLDSIPASTGYRLGGGAIHVVCLTDNDCFWNGALHDELFIRDFRLRILRKTGQPSLIAFVSGNSDGLIDLDEGLSSQSLGIIPSIPQEVWSATDVMDTSVRFRAVSPPMPVAVSSFPRFGGGGERVSRGFKLLAHK